MSKLGNPMSFYRILLLISIITLFAACNETPATVSLNVSLNPNQTEVVSGQQVALVSSLTTGEGITIKWRVEAGGVGGTLSADTGPAAIYTAGNREGVDIVTIEAVRNDGTVADSESIAFNVSPPTETPLPPPTATDTPTDTPPPTFTPTITFTPTAIPTSTPWPVRSACDSLLSTRIRLSSNSARPAEGWAEIVAPSNCAEDVTTPPNPEVVAFGTYSPELEGKNFWLLVYPSNHQYYPQGVSIRENGACKRVEPMEIGNGAWRAYIALGSNRTPDQFDLILVMTDLDSDADRFFLGWLQHGCETGDYPGIERRDLPEGLIELDAITVHTANP